MGRRKFFFLILRLKRYSALQVRKLLERKFLIYFHSSTNILLKTRDLLRDNKEVREWYKNYFSFILVDEYQDTNNLQEDLTSLLLGPHRNLFCVGDDWQAVYGFRGSNVNHFLSFPDKYENATLFRLEQNYRSTSVVLRAANEVIAHNRRRKGKNLWSDRTGGSPIELWWAAYSPVFPAGSMGARSSQRSMSLTRACEAPADAAASW